MTSPAHRAALDHVLDLILALPWSDTLVLRGSRLMRVWAGDLAREPADLDFVVLPDLSVPIDPLDPYPHVPGFDIVQQWPESADGAGRYEIWKDGDDEFDTRGTRAVVPPEGLRWDLEPDYSGFVSRYRYDLVEQVRRWPGATSGVILDPDGVCTDDTWTYSYGDDAPGGIRVIVPWRAPGPTGGRVQVDFALDERLPEPPVWTRIPLAHDTARQLLVQAATPELSLAWKLRWLHSDSAAGDGPRPKDLYDAVILAEDNRIRLSPRLLRRVMGQDAATAGAPSGEAGIGISPPSRANWSAFVADNPGTSGSAGDWLNRLASALAPMKIHTLVLPRGRARARE
jgi:Nucleotidyl transferase AbiEii toxin, Type IV TA system